MAATKIIQLAVLVIIFFLKFSIGLNTDVSGYALNKSSILRTVRSLAIVVLTAPFVAWLIAKFLDPSKGALTTIILLSSTPGAPLAVLKIFKAKGKFNIGLVVQMLAVLLSIITIPLVLNFFNRFGNVSIEVEWMILIRRILIFVIAPFALGFLLNYFVPAVRKIRLTVTKIGNMILGLLGISLLIFFRDFILNARMPDLIIFTLFILITLVISHLLSGPGKEVRTTITILSTSPHIGLTIFIAVSLFELQTIMAFILPYLVVNLIIGIIYIQWRRRA
ncbi:MAG: hypothetical protein P8X57_08840 [Cyclobacteriaceae bacterium]